MVTLEPALQWGFHDRGLLRVGAAADIVVFDPNTIAANMPEVVHDLPSGSKRLKQTARGIKNTIVNGAIFLENNEPTESRSGQLLRGPLGRGR